MKKTEKEQAVTGSEEKVKASRKVKTPEEKAEAAKARAAEKKKAEELKPELILQYQGDEVDLSALAEAAKADFHKEKKRTLVTDLKLYVKPEEHAAYYVVNGDYEGKITF